MNTLTEFQLGVLVGVIGNFILFIIFTTIIEVIRSIKNKGDDK